MLDKIKAWLRARLHLKILFTIPQTEITFQALVNRITGLTEITWRIPDYMRAGAMLR